MKTYKFFLIKSLMHSALRKRNFINILFGVGLLLSSSQLLAQATIGVAKQASFTTDLGGGQFETTLSFIVENLGGEVLNSVQVTDNLDSTFPAPATYSVSAGPTAVGFTANGGFTGSGDTSLLAGSDSLAVGATATISVTVQFAPNGATGPFNNTAVASGQSSGGTPTTDTSDDGDDPDPNGDGNPDENDPTPISFIAAVTTTDLSITKTDGVTSAVPGAGLTYTIVVANAGPDDTSASATVSDSFPAALQSCNWTCAASVGSACTATGMGNISDNAVDLLNGGTATYTANCAINPAATGTLSNTALVAAFDNDPDTSDNSATDGNTVLSPSADLAITVSDGVASATPGLGLTYTIVASNAGPSDEPSASVTDNFPPGVACTYSAVTAGGANEITAGGPSTLSGILALPSGSSVTYTASCAIDSSATGTLFNMATVTASVTDSTPGNNSATDGNTVLTPSADLAITVTDGVTSAIPGSGGVTYTIVASNAGLSDEPSATVADTFPADLSCTYTSVAAGGASGNTASGSGNLSETLALPSASSVTYTASCDLDGSATGTLSNTATVAGSVTDATPGNNSATDSDTVLNPVTDVSITMTDGVTSAIPGNSVTYTILARNQGPSTDPAATVVDAFPSDLSCSYTSVATGGATGNTSGSGNLSDTLILPFPSTVTYSAICAIDPAATGTLSNTATITESIDAHFPSNNSATDGDTVLAPSADLSITMSDGAASATPGDSVTYTIVASNAGPSVDPSATVADTFPSDLSCSYTSVAAGGATGNTASGSGNLSETLSLPSGSSVSYTAICLIDGSATGTLSNTATVTASVTDSNPGNNSATEGDTVLEPASADLSITIADNTGSSTPPFEYRIVASNAGPSDEPSANVSSTFAAGLSCAYNSLAAGGASGNTAGDGDLNDVLSIPAGGSVTYTAICVVDGDATGPFSSSVGIAGLVADPDSANDGSTVVIDALPNPSSHNAAPIPVLSNLGLILLSLLLMAIVFMTGHSTFQREKYNG